MFIEQGFKGESSWRRYLGGSFAVFMLLLVGQAFLAGVLVLKFFASDEEVQEQFQEGIDFSNISEIAGLSSNLITFLMLSSFAFAMLGVYLAVKFIHQRSFKSVTTTRKNFDWKRFLLSFLIIGGLIVVSTLVSYFSSNEDFIIQFNLIPFLILFVISIIFIPLQAGFEEYFFRGYLMQGLGVIFKNKWFPLIVTSVFFGVMHGANPEVAKLGKTLLIYYIGTGFFLGIVTLMDEGLELVLGFHIANNLFQILLITSTYSVFQTESVFKDLSEPDSALDEILFPLLVVYPLLILFFAKKYKWKDWKEKLTGAVAEPVLEETTPQDYFIEK